ncbi:hypothetical protein RND81_04G187800 [Saponaria officinalis]|uniref:Uncharacterized protein n=1 Tax=Saponaria officinalis TaxID=3572 RepID=A0AAW1LNC3_SAPOF
MKNGEKIIVDGLRASFKTGSATGESYKKRRPLKQVSLCKLYHLQKKLHLPVRILRRRLQSLVEQVFEIFLKAPSWALKVLRQLGPESLYHCLAALRITSIQGLTVAFFERDDVHDQRLLLVFVKHEKDRQRIRHQQVIQKSSQE